MVRTQVVNLLNVSGIRHNMLWPKCCVSTTYMVRTADPTKNSQPDSVPYNKFTACPCARQIVLIGLAAW